MRIKGWITSIVFWQIGKFHAWENQRERSNGRIKKKKKRFVKNLEAELGFLTNNTTVTPILEGYKAKDKDFVAQQLC